MCTQTCKTRNGKDKACYDNELAAQEAVEYVLAVHQNHVTPYYCNKCDSWHLSPANRHTPCHDCNFCIGHLGDVKKSYHTENAAELRASIIEKEQNKYLRVYECPYGDGWHLTSSLY
ncbi:hypothetical protein [Thalassotalea sp. Y01]|uniref:hypothetical protein n=1 Tax=Thalassotalea sp. Y01 TaxID=2729613 RepID=UPI00145FB200|nr:hypothetical protein [Thalassotalea sp. Y01]NMP16526.1 hypothetical protein [Thalassotalea sp. Y01]